MAALKICTSHISMKKVLCSISTRGRYDTTLPLAIASIIAQTKKIDMLAVFDDNDERNDPRKNPIYINLLKMLELKGIQWQWIYAARKGQHHNHQRANSMGYEWVWRMDDDTVAEPDVLEKLYAFAVDGVGAIGGSILTPTWNCKKRASTGKIKDINSEENVQWGVIDKVQQVDHLHCSFLYRAGVHDFNTNLSRVAHREETLFTYGLVQKGYQCLVIPQCITWHLKYPEGGIRAEKNTALYRHDEAIFRDIVGSELLG